LIHVKCIHKTMVFIILKYLNIWKLYYIYWFSKCENFFVYTLLCMNYITAERSLSLWWNSEFPKICPCMTTFKDAKTRPKYHVKWNNLKDGSCGKFHGGPFDIGISIFVPFESVSSSQFSPASKFFPTFSEALVSNSHKKVKQMLPSGQWNWPLF
jgi:hypothetical protein